MMKKILVVNANWIGDAIFSSPVFRALKQAYPQATISCLAEPRVHGILEAIAEIDEIIPYEENGQHRALGAKLRLIINLFQRHFDAAFLLHRSLTKALLVFCSGIPHRIGYNAKHRGIFLTHQVQGRPQEKVHRCDYYLQVLESFGITVAERSTSLRVDQEAQKEIAGILHCHQITPTTFLVIIHPGGNWNLKRWPPAYFTRLIDHLNREMDVRTIVTGTQDDASLIQAIIAPLSQRPLVLAGKINLRQLIALMKRANAVVSADSGPLHIAASVGTATLSIFGPTDPTLTGPRGTGRAIILRHDIGCNRQACYYTDCPDNTCMQAVSVAEVMDVIRSIRNS